MREVSSTNEKQTFRLGITPTVVPVLSPYLAKLMKGNGKIRLELQEGNTYYLKELLDDGTLDAAVIRTPVNLQGCRFLPVAEEGMAAVSRQLRKKKTVSLKELQTEPLILYRRYEPLIQETFEKYSLEMDLVCECEDARTAIALAEKGLGTAIVPMTIAQTEDSFLQRRSMQRNYLLLSCLHGICRMRC
jgi:DNA-binding transcriptional LysR family regulator